MRWGLAGKGDWFTIYTNPGHAFAVIAGLRLDTSAAGDPSGLKGPRWRPVLRSTRGFRARPPARRLLGHPSPFARALGLELGALGERVGAADLGLARRGAPRTGVSVAAAGPPSGRPSSSSATIVR